MLLASFTLGLLSFSLNAAESIKIGLIEPFSGPIASVGLEGLDNFRFSVENINARGGVLGGTKLEIVPLDNAMNSEKTTQQVKKAIDQGIRFIVQGIGSNHALNIIKQLEKHNKRNPDRSVLFLNHSAITTSFTNEGCSFWHFRFDANVDMKVAGLVEQIGANPKIKNVYMLNQNYGYGKSFQAAGRKMLKERASHTSLVGDDLIVPFGKVQDFTPYVAKIAAAKTDALLTGNWGPDLSRLVKAVADAGLNVEIYTFYAGLPSSVKGYGEKAGIATKIKQITENNENDEDRPDLIAFSKAFREKFKRTWYSDRHRLTMNMLAKAIDKAQSSDPKAVAFALEGLELPGPHGENIKMRADDHQIQMPMVVNSMDEAAPIKFVFNDESFGIGWKTEGWVSRSQSTLPTSCQMKRPAQ